MRLKSTKSILKELYLLAFSFYSIGSILLAIISFSVIPSLCIYCIAFWLISITTFFYLFYIPGKLYIANIALILGLASLIDLLYRLYRFSQEEVKENSKKQKINEEVLQENN